ncbi:MAG: hypothetical protein ACM3Q2_00280 [Syntrophothermus sp.]|jgi:hypothetical protein
MDKLKLILKIVKAVIEIFEDEIDKKRNERSGHYDYNEVMDQDRFGRTRDSNRPY